jgi:AsmA protein
MSKTIKWIVIIAAALVLLFLLVVIVVPLMVDVEKYKPQIEAQVSKATGRPFKLGGELKPSLFPWVGLSLADLHLGNPPGFEEKDFVFVDAFEVRVKLLPLLSRNIEVKRFVMKGPKIVLEKRKDGRGNWEGLGQTTPEKTTEPSQPSKEKAEASAGLPIERLVVGECRIADGKIMWLDHTTETRKEIRDINLALVDVSLDKPIKLDFRALLDERPFALSGTVGPLGKDPGKSTVSLDLVAELVKTVTMQLKGRIENPASAPQVRLAMNIASFSPRQLLKNMQQPLPYEPADSKVLNQLALSFTVSGDLKSMALSDGKLTIDDSQITFSALAKEFEKPHVEFDVTLDRMDLDRYLPAPTKEEKPSAEKTVSEKEAKKTDYEPLRRLVLNGAIKAGELKAKKIRMQNLVLKTTAKNGIIRLDPLSLDLYQGRLAVNGKVDVRQSTPYTEMNLDLDGTQVGPLVKDFMEKEIIEGGLKAKVALQLKGDQPETIRRTLNGKGRLDFTDGAIVGIDLANMVRNIKAKLALAETPSEKPRTDFSELVVPFSLINGLFITDGSKLHSPLLRLLATGSIDLSEETLDMRVVPKFVATLVGQGDKKQRSGLMVPVKVSGTFAQPTFQPDVESLIGQQLPDKKDIEKMIPPEDKMKEELEKQTQELFKGLPFGTRKKE